MKRDVEALLLDPAALSETPADLAACEDLAKDVRIEALKRWAYDIREQHESMPGTVAITLDEILDALHRLGADISMESGPPTEHGGF